MAVLVFVCLEVVGTTQVRPVAIVATCDSGGCEDSGSVRGISEEFEVTKEGVDSGSIVPSVVRTCVAPLWFPRNVTILARSGRM